MLATQEFLYTCFSSPLGKMLAVADADGLVALRFCEDANLTQELRHVGGELSGATLREDDRKLRPLVQQIKEVLQGKLAADQVPMHPRGTGFQKKVWQKLAKLPWGKTVSYSQLARSVGKPDAVRGVASACARNPIVFLVACHRVLRKDGSLGGYYYGLDFKQRLLDRERA